MAEAEERQRAVEERAQKRLDGIDKLPFSDEAYAEVEIAISDYIQDLHQESARSAVRSKGSEMVLVHDVQQAQRHLGSSRRLRGAELSGVLGGTLLGAGLGNVVALVSTEQLNLISALLTIVLMTVGASLVSFYMARSLR